MVRCETCSNLVPESLSYNPSIRHAQTFVKIRDIKDSSCPECTVIWNVLSQYKSTWEDAEYDRYIELVVMMNEPLVLLWRDNSVKAELFSGWKVGDASQDESTPTPFGRATRVAEHSSADECFQLAHSWFQFCMQNHKTCGSTSIPQLPTRVIDVHLGLGQVVDLVETGGQKGKYVALSYCWGPESSHTLRTTHSTLQQHKAGIPLASLPRTLKDAVTISRRLGIKYLWVDALCIIQDDGDDWARESSKMCDIYSNAEVTISADNSSGSDQGIFGNQRYGSRCLEIPYKNGKSIYVRKALAREHNRYDYSLRGPIPESINCRAWTLQEALLSNRILRYTSNELVWECNDSVFCECANSPGTKEVDEFDDSHVRNPAALARLPVAQIHGIWDNLVLRFTERSLGQEKDKLPALSGLASQFAAALQIASPAPPERYLAGMWLSNLGRSLIWSVEDDLQRDARDKDIVYRRPKNWRAPSWSWASVDSPVQLPLFRNFSSRLDIIEAEAIPSTVDKFGQVASGKLVVKGRVLHGLSLRTFDYVPGHPSSGYTLRKRYTVQYKQRLRTFTPDSADDFDPHGQSAGPATVIALLVGTIYTRGATIEHEEVFMVLRPRTSQSPSVVSGTHEVFERIGLSIREYREPSKDISDEEDLQKKQQFSFGTDGTQGFFHEVSDETIVLV